MDSFDDFMQADELEYDDYGEPTYTQLEFDLDDDQSLDQDLSAESDYSSLI